MDKKRARATGAGAGAVVGLLLGGPIGVGVGTALGGTAGWLLGDAPVGEGAQDDAARTPQDGGDGLAAKDA